jgi:hypothetical protein
MPRFLSHPYRLFFHLFFMSFLSLSLICNMISQPHLLSSDISRALSSLTLGCYLPLPKPHSTPRHTLCPFFFFSSLLVPHDRPLGYPLLHIYARVVYLYVSSFTIPHAKLISPSLSDALHHAAKHFYFSSSFAVVCIFFFSWSLRLGNSSDRFASAGRHASGSPEFFPTLCALL